MPWNTGGSPGPGQGQGPESPWGTPPGNPPPNPGPRRPPGWGGSGTSGGIPDIDEAIARAQAWARRGLRGGGGTGGGGRGTGGRWPGQLGGGRGLALVAGLGILVWLASGFYRVQPDQQGVVLRFGAFQRTTLPGLNYHVPWPVESVLTPAVTRINRIEVGFRLAPDLPVVAVPSRFQPGGTAPSARDVQEEALMLTGDENIVEINFSVFWRVRDAGDFLFNARNPAYTVKSAAESVMREVIGRTPIQPALTEARARIEQSVTTGTQAILDQYKLGVEITQVQLQKVDPPDAVIDSFRDVQRANTDAERMRNEAESYRNDVVPRARGDSARLVADAEAVRQQLTSEATGAAQRFLSVYQAYSVSKDVTLRRLYIETMQDVLQHTPTVVVDDQVRGLLPLLNLDGARGAAPGTAAPPGTSTPALAPPPAPPATSRGVPR
jgi:membrane protease subunit HflK